MAITFANLGNSVGLGSDLATNPDINSTTDVSSYSNASWTPPTSGLIYVFVQNRRFAADAGPADVPTMSGNNLTWVEIATKDRGGLDRVTLFAANASGSAVGATTVSFTRSQTQCVALFAHAENVDLSGGVVAAFVQVVTGEVTGGTSGSLTLAAASNSNNRPISGWAHLANEATTPRTNWTELDDVQGANADRGIETQYRGDAFETTASASWATSSAAAGIAAEIKALADETILISGTDTITASLVEVPGVGNLLTAADPLGVSLTSETINLVAALIATDSLNTAFIDTSSNFLASAINDTLLTGFLENTNSNLFSNVLDSLSIQLTEVADVVQISLILIEAADSLNVSISELAYLIAALSVSDTGTIGISEQTTIVNSFIAVADLLNISVSELAEKIEIAAILKEANDSLTLFLVEQLLLRDKRTATHRL